MTSAVKKIEYWMIFQNDHLVIDESTHHKVLMKEQITEFLPKLSHQYCIASIDEIVVFCAELNTEFSLPSTLPAVPFRRALDLLGKHWYQLAVKAYTILTWDKNHHYCGRCGELTSHKLDFERHCTACTLTFYPRISPSIIVLIAKGDEILMARSPHFTPGAYGLIAGFVEAGESVEDTVHREVKEEVGISIKNLQYFGSQAWPFPDSLMFAFTADYADGELTINPEEIETAGWYHYDQLPGRPSYRSSIAHKLLEHFIAQKKLTSLK